MAAPSLAERFGQVHAQALFVQAAIVAAHGASGTSGFRATDVRFFFLLFTNWLEHDVLHPGQDLDLTQVRRALLRLGREGLVIPVASPKDSPTKDSPRGARFALSSAGLVALVESLVDPRPRRPFEEVLFLVCFAASYRPAVLARLGSADADTRRVVGLLDPLRLLRSARSALRTLLADLDERVRSGHDLVAEAREATSEGAGPSEIARRLERRSAYQLHRVRPFTELVASLPEDLQRFELGEGIGLRVDLLFAPLAAQARAQIAALDDLEARFDTVKTPRP